MRKEKKELPPYSVEKGDLRDILFNTISGYIIGRVSAWFLPIFIPLQAREIKRGIKSLEDYALNTSATFGYIHGGYNIMSNIGNEPNNLTNYIPIMTNAVIGLGITIFNRKKNQRKLEIRVLDKNT